MSVTPFTVMVAVDTAGASAAFGAAAFFAVEEAVCDFWSGVAASNREPQAITVRRVAETVGRRRFTDSSRTKQQIANSSPEYHRFKCPNLT
jgi:hypothetical protein